MLMKQQKQRQKRLDQKTLTITIYLFQIKKMRKIKTWVFWNGKQSVENADTKDDGKISKHELKVDLYPRNTDETRRGKTN